MAEPDTETTPADENDDNWLYGDSNADLNLPENEADATNDKKAEKTGAEDETAEDEKEHEDNEANNDDSHFNDEHFAEVGRDDQDQAEQANGDADSQENGDSDSDDSDDVKVTIGEIKSGPQAYASLNIKRGVGLVPPEKPRVATVGGKVTLEDLDGPGSINGVPALEFNIDTIEDKPWNKPGADISDYFNYGFNEVTWSAYCERQRRMRVSEAGVTMHPGQPRAPPPQHDQRRPPGPVRPDESGMMPLAMQNNYQARENTIQVMTAERREYGRVHGRDAAAPPDYYAPPQDHYFQPPPHAPYDEPWGHPEQSGWTPTDIKELTPGPMPPPQLAAPMGLPPPHAAHPPHPALAPHPAMGPHGPMPGMPVHPPPHLASPYAPPYRSHVPPHAHSHERERERERERDRERERERARTHEREERERRDRERRDDEDRERDRDRERSRSIKPDRIREKSYRRERSRSRSRRHKSRSRSPRPRERERERSRDRERSVKPKKDKEKEKEDEK